MNDTCVCCGRTIPERRQVCLSCENWTYQPDVVLKDGTHLYFKTTAKPRDYSLQLRLYELLVRRLNENQNC